MRPRPTARTLVAAAATAAALVLGGCSSGADPDTTPTTTPTSPSTNPSAGGSSGSPTPSGSSTTGSAERPVAVAAVGSCWKLTRAAASKADAPRRTVKCDRPHTAQTYRTGNLVLVRNGHLLAVDSKSATGQAQTQCAAGLDDWLGGDARLSVLTGVWFTPTLAQSDAGAGWFRCDVIALDGADGLAALPADTKALLASDEGRTQFGLCRTAAPSAQDSQVVPCSAPHSHRALEVIDLPGETLPTAAQGAALMDTPCQDAATSVAPDPLQVSWEQELPTAEQWRNGRRYGVCWAPA